jgi:hypothetical protein
MTGHRNLGITVLVMGVILSTWRFFAKEKFSLRRQLLHLIVAFVMVTTMAFGADLGGLMVYKHGVGVKAAAEPEGHDHSEGGAGHADEPAVMHDAGQAEDGHHDDANAPPHVH